MFPSFTGFIPADFYEPVEAEKAEVFGCIGLGIMIGFIVLLVVADLDTYYRDFKRLKRNVTSFFHRLNKRFNKKKINTNVPQGAW